MSAIRLWLLHINQIPCKCGCRSWFRGKEYIMEGVLCEYECICLSCGRQVNYWAYGFFQYAWTYTGAIQRAWHRHFIFPVQQWRVRRNWRRFKAGKSFHITRRK